MERVVVLGASPNPSRVAFTAAHKLVASGHKIFPIGIKKGEVAGEKIRNNFNPLKDIDTITLYIGAKHQPEWYDFILLTNPKRVIFNPGTENPELYTLLKENQIDIEIACTLVLLASNQYELA